MAIIHNEIFQFFILFNNQIEIKIGKIQNKIQYRIKEQVISKL